MTAFFRTLPLALERDDLRIVHACWDEVAIEIARQRSDAVALYQEHAALITAVHEQKPDLDEVEKELDTQNRNPVKMLTSGPERRVAEPFWAAGKLRHLERVQWWLRYISDAFCVFGHYSTYRGEERSSASAFCADYAVAKRWQERNEGSESDFRGLLGAVRFPEQVVVFDNGEYDLMASSTG